MIWVVLIVVIVIIALLLWWWLSRSPGGPTATYLPPRRGVEVARPAPAPKAAPAAPAAKAEPPVPVPVVEPPAAVAVVEAAAPVPAPTTAAEPPQPDDLTVIEGIGPKISGMLRAEGITTFAGLAAADVSRLREIMLAANLRIANPATWPEQAALAEAGKWEELKALQDSLKGGRRA